MGKGSGTTRSGSAGNPKGISAGMRIVPDYTVKSFGINREYTVNGERYDYGELKEQFPEQAKKVLERLKTISSEMNERLIGKKVKQVIDNNAPIEIEFSSKNNKEFARQAMLTLSGRYFSRKEMLGIDKILKKATYVPTSHINTHNGSSKNTFWFTYKDATHSAIWFKVKRDMSGGGRYYLYSLTDQEK